MTESSTAMCSDSTMVESSNEPLNETSPERSSGYSSNSPIVAEVPDHPQSITPTENTSWVRHSASNVKRWSLRNSSECSSLFDLESPSLETRELGARSEGIISDSDSVCSSPMVDINPFMSSFRLSVCSLTSAFTYLDNSGICITCSCYGASDHV